MFLSFCLLRLCTHYELRNIEILKKNTDIFVIEVVKRVDLKR